MACRTPIRWYEPNGKRECERRRRQIRDGQLREANGLVWPKTPKEVETLLEGMEA